MKSTLALLVFAACAQAIGHAPTGCENAVEIESKMLGPVKYTTHACRGSPLNTTDAAPFYPLAERASSLEARQSNACTTTSPTCQSNVLCNNDYCRGTQSAAPILQDCIAIESALQGQANTGTVFVDPQTYVSLAYGTCEFRWGNLGTFTMEYALWNWGVLGAIVYNNCITVAHYGAGWCIPNNGLWFVQTVVPGAPL